MSEFDSDTVNAIATLAGEANPIRTHVFDIGGVKIPLAARFDGTGFQVIDLKAELAKWQDQPERIVGNSRALSIESFVELVNYHSTADTAIFADILSDQPSLQAVIDYHSRRNIDDDSNTAHYAKHRIRHNFPLSPEWKEWKAGEGKQMKQEAFALFLEDHIAELVSPLSEDKEGGIEEALGVDFGTPREIMTLSRGLVLHVASKVGAISRPQSGAGSIMFEEEHQDGVGRPLKVPGLFLVSIPLFFGGGHVRIPVRLRYRRADKEIEWSYHLYRAKDVVFKELKNILDAVASETGCPVFEGHPEGHN